MIKYCWGEDRCGHPAVRWTLWRTKNPITRTFSSATQAAFYRCNRHAGFAWQKGGTAMSKLVFSPGFGANMPVLRAGDGGSGGW